MNPHDHFGSADFKLLACNFKLLTTLGLYLANAKLCKFMCKSQDCAAHIADRHGYLLPALPFSAASSFCKAATARSSV